jgi:hypothetical protein
MKGTSALPAVQRSFSSIVNCPKATKLTYKITKGLDVANKIITPIFEEYKPFRADEE